MASGQNEESPPPPNPHLLELSPTESESPDNSRSNGRRCNKFTGNYYFNPTAHVLTQEEYTLNMGSNNSSPQSPTTPPSRISPKVQFRTNIISPDIIDLTSAKRNADDAEPQPSTSRTCRRIVLWPEVPRDYVRLGAKEPIIRLTRIDDEGLTPPNGFGREERKIELDEREKQLNERENALNIREKMLERENALNMREKMLDERENALNIKEKMLDEREKQLNERENAVNIKEKLVDEKESLYRDAEDIGLFTNGPGNFLGMTDYEFQDILNTVTNDDDLDFDIPFPALTENEPVAAVVDNIQIQTPMNELNLQEQESDEIDIDSIPVITIESTESETDGDD